MKQAFAVLAVAAVFALSACGNPTAADDDIINEPVPGEEQPLPEESEEMEEEMEEEEEETEG